MEQEEAQPSLREDVRADADPRAVSRAEFALAMFWARRRIEEVERDARLDDDVGDGDL